MAMGTTIEAERSEGRTRERELYGRVVAELGPALFRLVRGYEHDGERQRDLHQEILAAVWRSLPSFEARSSLRTWVYRVAHNTAASHVQTSRRKRREESVDRDTLDRLPSAARDGESSADASLRLERLAAFVRALPPLDRQTIMLHLEGLDPNEIAEVTGLSITNVTTKVHRIKALLCERMQETKP
jgi:RNA polymerase sigma-70 factor (ECF subfamily)